MKLHMRVITAHNVTPIKRDVSPPLYHMYLFPHWLKDESLYLLTVVSTRNVVDRSNEKSTFQHDPIVFGCLLADM